MRCGCGLPDLHTGLCSLDRHPSRDHSGPWEVTRYWNGDHAPESGDERRLVWSWDAVETTCREMNPTADEAYQITVVCVELDPVEPHPALA